MFIILCFVFFTNVCLIKCKYYLGGIDNCFRLHPNVKPCWKRLFVYSFDENEHSVLIIWGSIESKTTKDKDELS